MVQICLGVAVIAVFLSHAFILATCLYVYVYMGVCVYACVACVTVCFFTFFIFVLYIVCSTFR